MSPGVGPDARRAEHPGVRLAAAADCDAVGRLLHDFNTEYEDVTPGPAALAVRVRELLDAGETTILLAGAGPSGPAGLAVLRFRPSIWTAGLECYLAELYVVPAERGHGLGRALMETAIETARARGADSMDLGTSEDDVAARALYESLGFVNREGGPDGPISYFYELHL
jgi:ribosomal protein S18 acetylase RimI-like enzyme